MYRIDNATAVPNASGVPTPAAAGPNVNGFFTGGNPGAGTAATIVDADWLNAVQEELCNAITGVGLSLSKTDRTLLKQAIAGRIANGIAPGQNPSNNVLIGWNPTLTQLTAYVDATNLGAFAMQGWTQALLPLRARQVWATAGTYTWTVPSNVTAANVIVVGGGGAGGSTGSTGQQSAAGGGAGGAAKKLVSLTPGSTVTITVGAGGAAGAAGADGGAGGSSSFGAFCSATGGSGGQAANGATPAGGQGGSGSGGDVNFGGGCGIDAQTMTSTAVGGSGGNSIFGGAGRAGVSNSGAIMAGQAAGAGGGGAYINSNYSGGAGHAGIVIVEY